MAHRKKGTPYKPGRTDYAVGVASKPTKAEAERMRKYEAEDALRTLTRADEIRKDKSLMADVKKCAMAQKRALEKVVK